MSWSVVYLLAPELVLVLASAAIFLGGTWSQWRQAWAGSAVAAIIVAGLLLGQQLQQQFPSGALTATIPGSDGAVAADLFAQYVRWLGLASGALFALIGSRRGGQGQPAEFQATLLLVTAGLMLCGSANELALVFLGLELISIPTYILLYLGRKDQASQEAAAKYFFLSILSSAVMLYGFSFLYGATGSTRLVEIRAAIAGADSQAVRVLGRLALVLLFAGFGFKIAAVPFHFYAPDVYQGATNANAGLLSVAPKLAGAAALIRLFEAATPGFEPFAWRIALTLALATMTLGNLVALWQTNIRRMMAYSSIAHTGYLLVGLAAALAAREAPSIEPVAYEGLVGVLFYLAAYALATAGLFAGLTYLAGDGREVDTLDDLAGAWRSRPLVAGAMGACLFSLAGIPPLAGFWGKFALFFAALGVDGSTALVDSPMRQWFLVLALVGVVNAAIAATYYLRIVGAMFFAPPPAKPAFAPAGRGVLFATLVAAALVVAVGLLPEGLLAAARNARTALTATATTPPAAAPAPVAPAATVADR